MHVAFIITAYRTIYYHALAGHLQGAGHGVFWLSPNRRWARWLIDHGVAPDRVFDATVHAPEWASGEDLSAAEREALVELERASGLSLFNLIQMDHLILRRPTARAVKYLAVCQRHLREFLLARDVRVVFGEQTWAFELLVGQVCRALGIAALIPETVRIPDLRFAFFDGPRHEKLIALREVTDDDREQAGKFLEVFRRRRPQPVYMSVNYSYFRFRWQRIRLLTRHLIDLAGDPHDETSRRPAGLIIDHVQRVVRQHVNRRSRLFERPTLPPRRPFVLFPLHMQPESSIDVLGHPYCNQIELIRAMARTLPVSHELYVKEHSVALTIRPHGFYRQLRRIPGVRLIDFRANTFELMAHADLVVVVTGTAAYEAALLGRPAATIAPIFFDRIVRFPRFDPFRDSLARRLSEAEAEEDGSGQPSDGGSTRTAVEFLAWLMAQSFPGLIGDALWYPESMGRDRVAEAAVGFLRLLESPPPPPPSGH